MFHQRLHQLDEMLYTPQERLAGKSYRAKEHYCIRCDTRDKISVIKHTKNKKRCIN